MFCAKSITSEQYQQFQFTQREHNYVYFATSSIVTKNYPCAGFFMTLTAMCVVFSLHGSVSLKNYLHVIVSLSVSHNCSALDLY